MSTARKEELELILIQSYIKIELGGGLINKILAFCQFFICIGIYAQTLNFDTNFGINSIITRERLEGIEIITEFTLFYYNGSYIHIIKTEYANAEREFNIRFSERSNSYAPVAARISIDGIIHSFSTTSSIYNNGWYNRASWRLSDDILDQMRNCKEIAVEFGYKVYRYNENDILVDYFYNNPLSQIKLFLE